MKIKQLVLVIILILSLIGFLMPALFAAEMPAGGSEENPGILQSNPFYFVKEWSRGIHRAFTFNPVSKLQLDFQVATDKSAELKRLEEIGVAGDANLRAALLNYGESLKPLAERLRLIDLGDSIVIDLTSRTSKQVQLLQDLASRHADMKANFEATKLYLDQILASASSKLNNK